MATVTLIKAAARSRAGKGAARAERRSGRVPGIIYGDGKPPLPISLDYADLRQRIYAGRFLTTIHDVEVEGVKHRVIPRDFQLDAIRDLPLHVDFMRLGEGATIRVNIPIHVRNADQSPGVKRGGTVSIVTHSLPVRCRADAIPSGIEVDVARSRDQPLQAPERHHAARRRALGGRTRRHAGHGGAAVGLCRRNEGRCRSRRRCCGRCRRGCRCRYAGRRCTWRRSGCRTRRRSGGRPGRRAREEVRFFLSGRR